MINFQAIRVIYKYEMLRARHTLLQTIASPVISTSLYFVVFGAAIGSRIQEIDGVSYAVFIVPGLVMLSLLTQSIANASFAIFFPKFTGTIYEVMSAPVSFFEIIVGYVGAAASKSLILGTIILMTANVFVDLNIAHPFIMVFFLVLTCISFSLFGFIIGLWANNFEKLQLIPDGGLDVLPPHREHLGHGTVADHLAHDRFVHRVKRLLEIHLDRLGERISDDHDRRSIRRCTSRRAA